MKAERVLVAYGSKVGATAGIAEEIGRTLRDDGFDAVVPQADAVTDVRPSYSSSVGPCAPGAGPAGHDGVHGATPQLRRRRL